eukprot:5232824-Prymnesium_polylepis.1
MRRPRFSGTTDSTEASLQIERPIRGGFQQRARIDGVHLLAESVTYCRCRRCMLESAEGRPLTTPGQ